MKCGEQKEKMNKQELNEMIHKLSEYDAENFDMGDFYNLFRYGFKGYEHMNVDEIQSLYKTIFEDEE